MNDFAEPQRIRDLLKDLPCPWGVAGGWAIDLFLDRPTRSHKDIEVAIFRRDQGVARGYLAARGWSFQKVRDGSFFPWAEGESLQRPVHEICCRSERDEFLELLLNECTDAEFIFRRESRVRLPIERTFVHSASSIPILAPEVVLLYKSKRVPDDREQADFDNIVGYLDPGRRAWLCESLMAIYPDHAWLLALRGRESCGAS